MNLKHKNIRCPICGEKNTWSDENIFRPFCSERCKLIDLGEWADDKYRVAGEKINPEEEKKQNNAEDKE
jgi:endogenous inhibitor of DNA gyrase (YacG/DUF329 family)